MSSLHYLYDSVCYFLLWTVISIVTLGGNHVARIPEASLSLFFCVVHREYSDYYNFTKFFQVYQYRFRFTDKIIFTYLSLKPPLSKNKIKLAISYINIEYLVVYNNVDTVKFIYLNVCVKIRVLQLFFSDLRIYLINSFPQIRKKMFKVLVNSLVNSIVTFAVRSND